MVYISYNMKLDPYLYIGWVIIYNSIIYWYTCDFMDEVVGFLFYLLQDDVYVMLVGVLIFEW